MGDTWLYQKPVLLISSGVLQGRYFVDFEGVGDVLETACHEMPTPSNLTKPSGLLDGCKYRTTGIPIDG